MEVVLYRREFSYYSKYVCLKYLGLITKGVLYWRASWIQRFHCSSHLCSAYPADLGEGKKKKKMLDTTTRFYPAAKSAVPLARHY